MSFLHLSDGYPCCSQTYMYHYVFGYFRNLNMLLVGFIILIGFVCIILNMNNIVILKVKRSNSFYVIALPIDYSQGKSCYIFCLYSEKSLILCRLTYVISLHFTAKVVLCFWLIIDEKYKTARIFFADMFSHAS